MAARPDAQNIPGCGPRLRRRPAEAAGEATPAGGRGRGSITAAAGARRRRRPRACIAIGHAAATWRSRGLGAHALEGLLEDDGPVGPVRAALPATRMGAGGGGGRGGRDRRDQER